MRTHDSVFKRSLQTLLLWLRNNTTAGLRNNHPYYGDAEMNEAALALLSVDDDDRSQ